MLLQFIALFAFPGNYTCIGVTYVCTWVNFVYGPNLGVTKPNKRLHFNMLILVKIQVSGHRVSSFKFNVRFIAWSLNFMLSSLFHLLILMFCSVFRILTLMFSSVFRLLTFMLRSVFRLLTLTLGSVFCLLTLMLGSVLRL